MEQVLQPLINLPEVTYRTLPIKGWERFGIKHLYGVPYGQNYFLKGDHLIFKNLMKTRFIYLADNFIHVDKYISNPPYDTIIVVYDDDDNWHVYDTDDEIIFRGHFRGFFKDVMSFSLIDNVEAGDIIIVNQTIYLIYSVTPLDITDMNINLNVESILAFQVIKDNKYYYDYVDIKVPLTLLCSDKIINKGLIVHGDTFEVRPNNPLLFKTYDLKTNIDFIDVFDNPEIKYLCVENDSSLNDQNDVLNLNIINNIIGILNIGFLYGSKNYHLQIKNIENYSIDVYPLSFYLTFASTSMNNITLMNDTLNLSTNFKTGNEILMCVHYYNNISTDLKIFGSLNACRTIFKHNGNEIDYHSNYVKSKNYKLANCFYLGDFRPLSKSIYLTSNTTGGTVIISPSFETLDKSNVTILNNVCFKSQQLEKIPMMMNQSEQIVESPQDQVVELKLIDEFGRPFPKNITTISGEINSTDTIVYIKFLK